MVELRKRKDPPPGTQGAPLLKKTNSVNSSASSGKKTEALPKSNASSVKVNVGDTIDLETFGGEIETNEGAKTSLKKLVEDSEAGVVLFTYPKASTPGCTKQACLFRDEFKPLTATGLSIYGLSTDSPKSNSTFKLKQNLPYTLLCDPKATLISAIGMKKAPSGTTRGVFVINKKAKVEASEPGAPAATVEVVRKLVEAEKVGLGQTGTAPESSETSKQALEEDKTIQTANAPTGVSDGDAAKANVAAEVADSAQKLDEDLNV